MRGGDAAQADAGVARGAGMRHLRCALPSGRPATVFIYEQYVDEARWTRTRTRPTSGSTGGGFFRLMRAQQIKYLDAIV